MYRNLKSRLPLSKIVLVNMMMLALMMVACQSGEPEQPTAAPRAEKSAATVVPTIEPTVVPTEEAPAEMAEEKAVDAPALTTGDWQWVAFTDPIEQFDVDTPENYHLKTTS